MQEETRESKSALPRFFTLEMFMFTVTALSGLVLLWSIAVPYRNVAIMVCAGVGVHAVHSGGHPSHHGSRFGARSSV